MQKVTMLILFFGYMHLFGAESAHEEQIRITNNYVTPITITIKDVQLRTDESGQHYQVQGNVVAGPIALEIHETKQVFLNSAGEHYIVVTSPSHGKIVGDFETIASEDRIIVEQDGTLSFIHK